MCYADQIKPVNPKGNQPWIVIGAKAETPILFPPDAKSQVTGKDPDSGKDRSQEEKGWQDETDGWMASPTQWTWVWASYGRWWRTGKPNVLQSTGVAKSWTQLNEWTTALWCWYVNKQIIQGMEIKQITQRNRISTTEIDPNTRRYLMYDKENN